MRKAAVEQGLGVEVEKVSFDAWTKSYERLELLFDLAPDTFFAFYANEGLMPWQGAVSWVGRGGASWIQLRRSFLQGRCLGFYSQEEVLAHEAVHVARGAFQEPKWEEIFAYRVSKSRWRRWCGPLIESPWEVWLFFAALILGEGILFMADSWMGFGLFAGLLIAACVRRGRREWVLSQAKQHLLPLLVNREKAEALLVRLQDREIEAFARFDAEGIRRYIAQQTSLRWQVLRVAYFWPFS